MRTRIPAVVAAIILLSSTVLTPGVTGAPLDAPLLDALEQTPPPADPPRTVTYVPYTRPGADRVRPATGPGWTTIISEGFEGSWPSTGWETFDNDGPANGEYCWAATSYQTYQGSGSAWPAAGCANALSPSTSMYPNLARSWMVYGPFSLAGATGAQVHFRLWQQVVGEAVGGQINGDVMVWAASVDGRNFSGIGSVGSSTAADPPTSEGWDPIDFDLTTDVPDLGNLAGRAQVWIAWIFESDAAVADNGPFVDDIVIERLGPGGTGDVGGRSFSLSRTPAASVMNWNGGTFQSSYLLARVPLPAGQPAFLEVAADATSYSDSATLTESFYCYTLVPMGSSGAIALSDTLCVFPNTHSQSGAPGQFTLRLNQSNTASFSWQAPGGQSSYLLGIIPLNGTQARFATLAGSATTTTNNTAGVPTCYLLVAMQGNAPRGYTDALCAIPGVSSVGGSTATTPSSTPQPRTLPNRNSSR